MKRTLENSRAAWVQGEDGSWVIRWLGQDGKPDEPVGVDREIDAPAAHTPRRAAAKQSRPIEEQQADMWPASQ